MDGKNARTAKLLVVLSNDFGELSNALYLNKGYDFSMVLLLPDRLFAVNQDSLTVRTRRYSSIQDVIAAIDQEQPDIVFLFSGYLYAINNIFAVETVATLVQNLQRKKCRIVTSDPFLGITAKLDASSFSDRHPRKEWLTQHFSRLFAILRDVPHLYLVKADGFPPTRSIAFFNENIVVSPAVLDEYRQKLVQRKEMDPSRKRWLFVLALEDYGYLVSLHGKAGADALLLAKLRDTAREGRQPILVAPQPCIAALTSQAGAIERLVLLPFCSYDRFMVLLLEAEYVFYWNIFSNSIPARVVNQLPVFFFGRGHMVHAFKPLLDVGMKHYYPESELPYLPMEQRLAAQKLAALASGQGQSLAGARANFRRSPGPEAMIEQILDESGQ